MNIPYMYDINCFLEKEQFDAIMEVDA